jgi:hypothetical protein
MSINRETVRWNNEQMKIWVFLSKGDLIWHSNWNGALGIVLNPGTLVSGNDYRTDVNVLWVDSLKNVCCVMRSSFGADYTSVSRG